MICLVDTHAHLNFREFEKDTDEVIKRAVKNGVGKIICASSDIASSQKALELSQQYSGTVYAAIGIHPQQTDPQNRDSSEDQLVQLEKLAGGKGVVAIGECGLDYSPAPPPETDRSKEEQSHLFNGQIQIAFKHHLPLIIHSREAFTETIEILSHYQAKGVFHCYTGGKKGIARVQALGFYFGIDGNLTYDEGLRNVFSLIPLEQTLLETDAPWLAPLAYRGSRNEPAYLQQTAACLAKIKQIPMVKLTRILYQNTINLFQVS